MVSMCSFPIGLYFLTIFFFFFFIISFSAAAYFFFRFLHRFVNIVSSVVGSMQRRQRTRCNAQHVVISRINLRAAAAPKCTQTLCVYYVCIHVECRFHLLALSSLKWLKEFFLLYCAAYLLICSTPRKPQFLRSVQSIT